MIERLRWPVIIGMSCVFLAILMQGPQLLHMMHADWQGIPVSLNADESVYLARVQEALNGRGAQSAEAFVGDSDLQGSQFALIERLYGTIFSWTDFRAAHVLQIMDSVIPVLIFLVMFWFLQLAGFTRMQAFVGTVIFTVLQLYNLNRPIHLRSSFLVMLFALSSIIAGMRGQWVLGIVGGALLGVLVGVYFWSWTFAWVWFSLYLLWEFCEWWYQGNRGFTSKVLGFCAAILGRRETRKEGALHRWHRLVLIGGIGIVVASPFVWQLWSLTQHPLYEYASFRSGMRPGRLPESLAYSVLFFTMVVGVGMTLLKSYEKLRPYRPAVVTLFVAFIVIHQQFVHGIIFNFVSHSIFSLALASICMILLAYNLRTKWIMLSALAAVVYLTAIGYDGKLIIGQWMVGEGRFSEQHFASVLPVLDELPRATILSDPGTLAFIASSTKHDVVYSIYLKNVLMTHEEIAERYCLMQLPVAPAQRNIAQNALLVYPDANGAFRDDPTVREREVKMVEEACARFDQNPENALENYGVSYILWDEKRRPDWDLERMRLSLKKAAEGEGWSLWEVAY